MKSISVMLVLFAVLLGITRLCFAADDGAKIVDEVCSACHTAKTRPLDKMHLTKEQWNEAIEKMIGFGADVPKAKIPALVDYLVGMNAATADPAKK